MQQFFLVLILRMIVQTPLLFTFILSNKSLDHTLDMLSALQNMASVGECCLLVDFQEWFSD